MGNTIQLALQLKSMRGQGKLLNLLGSGEVAEKKVIASKRVQVPRVLLPTRKQEPRFPPSFVPFILGFLAPGR